EGGVPPDLAGALAAFRLTRRVAQNLGAFYCQAASRGWPAALDAWGLKEAAAAEGILSQSRSRRRPGWCGAFWGTPSICACSWTWGNPWKLRPRASPLSGKAQSRLAGGLSER